MPYIQVELDAMERVPEAASLAGIPACQLGWGLVLLWRDCWRSKSALVTLDKLEAFFGAEARRVGRALATFGFAEWQGDGTLRVRGAVRYLRISEARSAAGRARASTARRTKSGRMRVSSSKCPAIAGEVLDESPASDQHPASEKPALTANSEQQSAKENLNLAGAVAPPGGQEALPGLEAEKRHPLRRQLSDALIAEHERQRGPGYKFSKRDAKALGGILDAAAKACPSDPVGEAVRRYRYGLTRTFQGLSDIHELERFWNRQAPPKSHGPPPVSLRDRFPDENTATLRPFAELERAHG